MNSIKQKSINNNINLINNIDSKNIKKDFNSILLGNFEFNKIFNNYEQILNIDEIKKSSFNIIQDYEDYFSNNDDINNINVDLIKISELLINSKKIIINDISLFYKIINIILFRKKETIVLKSFDIINDSVDKLKKDIVILKKFNNTNSENINKYFNIIKNRINLLKKFNKLIYEFINKNNINENQNIMKPFINLEKDIELNISNLIEIRDKLLFLINSNNNSFTIIESIELKVLFKLEPLIISILLSSNKKRLNNINNSILSEIDKIEQEGEKENNKLKIKENDSKNIKLINSIILDIDKIVNKK